MKCLMLNYLPYDFINQQTGQVVQGVNLYVVPPFNVNDSTVGMEVSKYSLSVVDFEKFKISNFTFPCLANIETFTSNTLKGKSVSKLLSVDFLEHVDLLAMLSKK